MTAAKAAAEPDDEKHDALYMARLAGSLQRFDYKLDDKDKAGVQEWDERPSTHASASNQRVARHPGKPSESKARLVRRPSYKTFKDWVSRDEYDRRMADNVCLGCGKRHHWIKFTSKENLKDKQE
ncbi:hypothetical protein GGF44_002387 [Coemansia sp. RSA 1694]|nr:hypothetical protein GGF44_002387 [Coemansia sp. RSA 1694]